MQPETFAQEPTAAVAHNSVAKFAGGNHSESGLGASGQFKPVEDEAAADQSVSLLLEPRKIAPLPESHRAGQPQPGRCRRSHFRQE